MNSFALLDAYKAHNNLPSDYSLAKLWKVTPQSIKEMRTRGLSDERIEQICSELGFSQAKKGEAIATVHAERAKSPAVKKMWEQMARQMRTIAAAILVCVTFFVASLSFPQNANAADASLFDITTTGYTLFDIVRRLLAAASRWVKTLFDLLRSWSIVPLMRKGLPAVGLCLFLSVPAHADDWSRADTWRQIGYTALAYLDARQSAASVDDTVELNPMLGSHPSRERIYNVTAAAVLLDAAVAWALPPQDRFIFQTASIVVETSAVTHNYSIGIRVGRSF